MQVYFVTGATGFLGSTFLKVASQNPHTVFYCLIRSSSDVQSAEHRLQHALSRRGIAYDPKRFIAIEGNIEKPKLGLHPSLYAALSRKITTIIHSAALVGFLKPLNVLRKVNVEGTRHIIDFAHMCKKRNAGFCKVGIVGTAYVAGARTGTVYESEFTDAYGFRNAYEQSKHEAECLARDAMTDLPIVVFRPSIIIGSVEAIGNQVGVFDVGQTLQPSLKLLLSGSYRFAPLNPNCPMDFISVDDVARAMVAVMSATVPGLIGDNCFLHLTTGSKYPYTLADYADIVNDEYAALIPSVRFVSPDSYQRHVRPRFVRDNPKFAMVVEMFDQAYQPYLMQNPVFDTENADAVLSGRYRVMDPAIAFRSILRRAAAASASLAA